MHQDLCPLEKLRLAYELTGEVLSQAPELYDARLDQALLLLHQAGKRARRIPRLRLTRTWRLEQTHLPF